jgi:hypothetical protein
MTERTDRKLIATGVVGTVIAALCCFTPILVVLLGAVGLAGLARLCAAARAGVFNRPNHLCRLAAAAAQGISRKWMSS